jgi:glycosyltransferase involved in cell wall biosynthesis
VLYHFFHPDNVVSARIFAEFCAQLSLRGWDVTAWPCNRACHDTDSYRGEEEWQGVVVRRVWRPGFRQSSGRGRILNAAWMLTAWCWRVLSRRQLPDVLVIGTDPMLSVLVAPIVRKFRPDIRIVHWCFDLYPESPVAEGMVKADGWLVRGLQAVLRRAYASCDLVVDLGPCMRDRLKVYAHGCPKATLAPWALVEPAEVEAADPTVRRELFGDSSLGLLYSGNFGRAHSSEEFLELARCLRDSGCHFSFGVRGNRADELRAAISPEDGNVSLAGFVPESALAKRLAAADIHLVSVRPEWTGLVVPSKFFGSLAVGRPVLFAGSRGSAVARWIVEQNVGWVLDGQSRDAVAAELRHLARCPEELQDLRRHCHQIYRERFSRSRVMDEWSNALKAILIDAHLNRAVEESNPGSDRVATAHSLSCQ